MYSFSPVGMATYPDYRPTGQTTSIIAHLYFLDRYMKFTWPVFPIWDYNDNKFSLSSFGEFVLFHFTCLITKNRWYKSP